MDNYLLAVFQDYLADILRIERKLIVTESCLHTRTEQVLGENRENPMLFDILTSYRDLTVANDDDM